MLENLDKIMHLRFNFDACPMHSPFGFVHLRHQNLSARALFCLNSLAKVNTQLLIYNYMTNTQCCIFAQQNTLSNELFCGQITTNNFLAISLLFSLFSIKVCNTWPDTLSIHFSYTSLMGPITYFKGFILNWFASANGSDLWGHKTYD